MARATKPIAAFSNMPPIQRLLCALSVGLVGVAAYVILKYGRNVTPLQVQVCWIALASFLATLLSWGSKAFAEGKIGSFRFTATGQLAAFVIIYGLLYFFAPNFTVQSARLFLEKDDRILDVSFRALIHVPGSETIEKAGEHGSVLFQLPGDVDTIRDVGVKCAGFEVASKGPYTIKDGTFAIKMRESGLTSPALAEEFPSEQSIDGLPTPKEVAERPSVNPKEVTFQYKNLTTADLRLVFLSCTAYYDWLKNGKAAKRPAGVWLDWDFPARDEFVSFSNFSATSSGWYCFFVARIDRSTGNRKYTFLGSWNLFQTRTPVLTVRESKDQARPFIAEFRTTE